MRLLDCQAYFDLLNLPQPKHQSGRLDVLASDDLIRRSGAGRWDVTNLGAILLAKRLDDFRSLRRKAVRVIQRTGATCRSGLTSRASWCMRLLVVAKDNPQNRRCRRPPKALFCGA